MNTGAAGDRKRASDLQAVSRPAWLLGAKLRCSPSVVCTFLTIKAVLQPQDCTVLMGDEQEVGTVRRKAISETVDVTTLLEVQNVCHNSPIHGVVSSVL